MNNFVGIDLGTTNSVICSYNGEETRIWKSPEQNDVTPSAIYIDRRGNKYVGKRAYDSAPHSPGNAATLFKRLIGTSTPINLPAVNITKTPEECSAEILKVLFGYLPEEIRNNPSTGTVITVPAAFNQMQKDATMHAAQMADIGNVALMQEPVAAVMSVMRTRNSDGIFLIYDLGGGTLDIAIAESMGGHVNLLSHGGIAMCGGRDFDRVIVDNIIKPWLFDNFNLPDDLSVNPNYNSLIRLALWATERAKIELSSREEVVISLSETEARVCDLSGNEIYLDIPFRREAMEQLIAEEVNKSIQCASEIISKAGLSHHDIQRIVFVGGPTNYKPLRERVAYELGIDSSTEVNPMTCVAEGASIFAESIDWSSKNRSRKSTRGQLSSHGKLSVTFNYISRTPNVRAKIAVQVVGEVIPGAEFQVDSIDTAWTSGRVPLATGATIDVSLLKTGDNTFKVFVFDSQGGPISLEQDRIVITRTNATVDGIPASHSIGIEVLDKLGGRPMLEWLVRAGDPLPKKGKMPFKAAESLKAGASGSLNFNLWEGDIEDCINDNRPIGALKIKGSDFDDGVIPAGADLECDYEILDSGNIVLEVSVPDNNLSFHSDKNFYSRQGELDFSSASAQVINEGARTLNRLEEINANVDNPKLDQARERLETAISLDPVKSDAEIAKKAMDKVLEAKRLLAQVRKENLREIRQIDLTGVRDFFNEHVRTFARPSEERSFDNLVKTAQRSIDLNDRDFENLLDELKGKNFEILWRQDWFVIQKFKWIASSPHLFTNKHRFEELTAIGNQLLKSDDIEKLRQIVYELSLIQIHSGTYEEMFCAVNIIRG